ncbi:unnamed protein product [Chrysoparadoxa australica]
MLDPLGHQQICEDSVPSHDLLGPCHHLVADTLLRKDVDVWPGLERFRNVSKAFKKSPLQANNFLAAQRQVNGQDKGALCMVLDVPTRWWSLLSCIDRWLRLKEHIIHWKAQQEASSSGSSKADESAPFAAVRELTTQDWLIIEHLQPALPHFKEAEVTMETSKHPSVSLVPLMVNGSFCVLEKYIADLQKKRDDYEEYQDMEKRFGIKGTLSQDPRFFLFTQNKDVLPRMAWCAVALDPRTKDLAVGVAAGCWTVDVAGEH